MKAAEFYIGGAVLLTRCRADYARGQIGTITKIIKRRDCIRVRLDSGPQCGQQYDADAVNVDVFGAKVDADLGLFADTP